MDRRHFLLGSAMAASGVAALAASLSPLRHLDDFPSMEQFLQKYYKQLTPAEMEKVLARIQREVEQQYGVRPKVRDLKPMDGVEFVYCLNLTRCIGCRKCVHACVAENNQSRVPEIQYIRVLRLPHGSLDIEKAEHYYSAERCLRRAFFTCRCSASSAPIRPA
jgi:ferredoxin